MQFYTPVELPLPEHACPCHFAAAFVQRGFPESSAGTMLERRI